MIWQRYKKIPLKAAGNSIPLWVERDSRPAARALVCSFPCPIPNAQKLHPLVGGVFHLPSMLKLSITEGL
ncbi:hypothetical protein H6G41_10225 [Tolypothrix sp. FACHB-123]|uniref:hypothetical protein n=1 Tax=Tolypothrix sp. FACHB-123 TaxID=2692868 RepID=UPI001686F969|nr:hypothetical protein [Tolypothrix sp. FACHB-123]MBD2354995.1 hypothetical protein [Tolypothrix sp. FACHB-123]